jgi:hypothetical protein
LGDTDPQADRLQHCEWIRASMADSVLTGEFLADSEAKRMVAG